VASVFLSFSVILNAIELLKALKSAEAAEEALSAVSVLFSAFSDSEGWVIESLKH